MVVSEMSGESPLSSPSEFSEERQISRIFGTFQLWSGFQFQQARPFSPIAISMKIPGGVAPSTMEILQPDEYVGDMTRILQTGVLPFLGLT